MPKTKKKFTIQDTNSNGNFITVTNYYYNNFTECRKVDEPISDEMEGQLAAEGFSNDIVTSNFDAFKREILKSINTQNAVYLEALLKLDFVYESGDNVWTDDNNLLKPRLFFKNGTVRPILEAFFYDQVDAFIEIMYALINKNSEELFTIFIQAIQLTELNDKAIFEWDDAIKLETLKFLSELLKHAEKIGNKDKNDLSVEKGSKLYSMTDTLIQDVKAHEVVQRDTLKQRCENLHYKLSIKNSMHEDDELLAQHHGRIQRGLRFFRGNKPDSQNYVSMEKYNNSIWATKTKSQKKVEKIEAALFPRIKLH